jgi:hypothetical protein
MPTDEVNLYMDDTNLYVIHENIVALSDKINFDISVLHQWSLANKLTINKKHVK